MAQSVEKTDGKFVRSTAAVAGVLISIMAGPISSANAQYRGTPEMQQACTPDVMRLCSADVPDVEKIVACMKRNRANLSPACGAVFGAGLRHDPRRH
jgi:Cysteine rich repeat